MTKRSTRLVRRLLLVAAGLPAVLFLAVASFFALLNPVFFHAPDLTSATLVSSGEPREYLLHVPKSYEPGTPTPLVISLHGAAMTPSAQLETSRWAQAADRHGFLVASPSGVRTAPVPLLPRLPVWRLGTDAGRESDVRFVAELIDTLEARYSVDRARIYVAGFSNGGGMASVLSCALSGRIAAVGLVAAAAEPPECAVARPIPMIAFHGTADRIVPYDGGSLAARWARRNACAEAPIESAVAPDVTRMDFTGCAADAAVVFYTIRGGGHSWPGGRPLPRWMVGSTSASIDATELMWAFFRERALYGVPLPRLPSYRSHS